MKMLRLCNRIIAGFLVLLVPAAGEAQEPAPDDTVSFRPFFSAGISSFVGDFGEGDHQSLGPMVRAGLRFPGSTAALTFSRWGEVAQYRLTSLQLDLEQDLTDRRAITPTLFVGAGHTWGTLIGTGAAPEQTGASAAFGLGIRATVVDRFGVKGEAGLRTDNGGWNAEWRLLAEVGRGGVLARGTSHRSTVVTSWMTPLGGPWVTVEPAFGLRVKRGGGVLTVQMVHWQMPRQGAGVGYGWDTRGLIAAGQTDLGLGDRLSFRIGPAISAMGEGPDNGVSFGSAADLVLTFDIGSVQVESGVGYLMLDRSRGADPSDQRGLTWSLGLGM